MPRKGRGQTSKGKKKPKKAELVPSRPTSPDPKTTSLLGDIRSLIETARSRVATTVNTELVMLNWRIGSRIRQDILGQERAGYGKRVVASLAEDLTATYGRGFSRPSLFRMVQFAEISGRRNCLNTVKTIGMVPLPGDHPLGRPAQA
jgi:hypothetical protein